MAANCTDTACPAGPGRSQNSDSHAGQTCTPRVPRSTRRRIRPCYRARLWHAPTGGWADGAGAGSPPVLPAPPGSPAVRELSGTTPSGAPVQVVLGSGRTVLLFLTSSCYGCRPLWDGPGRTGATVRPHRSPRARDPQPVDGERTGCRRPGAPDGTEVLMSSEAWHAFGVTAAPWFVVVADGIRRDRGCRAGHPGMRCEPGSVQRRPSGQRRPARRPSTACHDVGEDLVDRTVHR